MSFKKNLVKVAAVTNPLTWFVAVPFVIGVWASTIIHDSVKRTVKVIEEL